MRAYYRLTFPEIEDLCASMREILAERLTGIGKVRLRVPSSIKAGDVVRVRALVIHPMERVERDKQGKIVQKNYHYISKVVVTRLGRTVVSFDTTQSVSESPFFAFTFRATDRAGSRDVHGHARRQGRGRGGHRVVLSQS